MIGTLYFRFLAVIAVIVLCPNIPTAYGEMGSLELGVNTGSYNDVIVQEVLRANMIRLESGETVKLIGVRAFGNVARKKKVARDEHGFVIQEKVDLEVPVEEQALEFMRELLKDKHVRLEFDAVQKDDEYKTLAYVFLIDGDVFANARILERGLADLQIQAPNLKYATQLREAYREGRAYTQGMDE